MKQEMVEALSEKMVFLSGPRQVGKTTLALDLLPKDSEPEKAYLNWDRRSDRNSILRDQFDLTQRYLIFDEIHKYSKWKNLIKGLYDKHKKTNKFIVTGSARLDYFQRGGDSLLGRYRHFRLHPFSLAEVSGRASESDVERLLKFGGFPEPLVKGSETGHRIWQRDRSTKIVREDLRDLTSLRDVGSVELLARLLPDRVGSPLSYRSLQEDLQVSQPTVENWVQMLCRLYYCFSVSPYGAPKVRALKKIQKFYMWDWSQVKEIGFRFENMVASHLLKYCHWIEDTQGYEMELRYLRDSDGREIDFVVLKENKPIFAVEVKVGDREISPSLKYFRERTKIPHFYQVHLQKKSYGEPTQGRVLPFIEFSKEVGLV